MLVEMHFWSHGLYMQPIKNYLWVIIIAQRHSKNRKLKVLRSSSNPASGVLEMRDDEEL